MSDIGYIFVVLLIILVAYLVLFVLPVNCYALCATAGYVCHPIMSMNDINSGWESAYEQRQAAIEECVEENERTGEVRCVV